MLLTADQLREVMPYSAGRVPLFIMPLNQTLERFGINTGKRISAFLAQIAHESGEMRFLREIHGGQEYEGRVDLGNTVVGDGSRYVGRGLIQLTGRTAYAGAALALDLPLLTNPTILEAPEGASLSAGWFWQSHGLNELADVDKFGEITHRINGGYNGLDARLSYWLRARHVWNL